MDIRDSTEIKYIRAAIKKETLMAMIADELDYSINPDNFYIEIVTPTTHHIEFSLLRKGGS